mgnify:CR=1 FL=1
MALRAWKGKFVLPEMGFKPYRAFNAAKPANPADYTKLVPNLVAYRTSLHCKPNALTWVWTKDP